MKVVVDTQLNNHNYLLFEERLIRAVTKTSSTSLPALLRNKKTSNSVVLESIRTRAKKLALRQAEAERLLVSLVALIDRVRSYYLVTNEDVQRFAPKSTSKLPDLNMWNFDIEDEAHSEEDDFKSKSTFDDDMSTGQETPEDNQLDSKLPRTCSTQSIRELLGDGNAERWDAAIRGHRLEAPEGNGEYTLEFILKMNIQSDTLRAKQILIANEMVELSQERQSTITVKNSVEKKLVEESALLSNLLLSEGADGLIEINYLRQLKGGAHWDTLYDAAMKADICAMLDLLFRIEKGSVFSSKYDVARAMWRLTPHPGEILGEFDTRFVDALELWKRDARLPLDQTAVVYMYAENLRAYGADSTVSLFLQKYLANPKKSSIVFEEFRRELHSTIAQSQHSSGDYQSSEDMIISAAAVDTLVKCQICGKDGHTALKCYKYKALENNKAQKRDISSSKTATQESSPRATHPKQEPSSKGVLPKQHKTQFKQPAATTNNAEKTKDKKPNVRAAIVNNLHESEDDGVEICPTVVVAKAGVWNSSCTMQLDNGANTHILNDRKLFLEEPKLLQEPVSVSGVFNQGNTSLTRKGITKHFGEAYYEPDARNIISQSKLEKLGFRTEPIRRGNIIHAWNVSKGELKLKFKLRNGIFEGPIDPVLIAAITTSEANDTNSRGDTDEDNTGAPSGAENTDTTVTVQHEPQTNDEARPSNPEPNSGRPYSTKLGRHLTKAEEERVNLAKIMHENLGHQGRAHESRMLKGGHLTNCKLCEKDLDIYYEIIPNCPGCLKGKMRAPGSIAFKPPTGAKLGEFWEGDIMFLGPNKYLVVVEVISNFAYTIPIKTRHDNALSQARKIWNTHLSSRFNVNKVVVYTDREGGLQGLNGNINGISVSVLKAPTEGHANRAEVLIRIIKERSRSILYSLPYKLPKACLDYLIKYVVQIKNLSPATTNAESTPAEVVSGCKLNFNDLINLGFGEQGHAFIPIDQREKKNDPTAEEGILVGFDQYAPHNKIIYVVDTKRTVSRLKFVKSPISKEGMDKLNADPINLQDLESPVVSSTILSMEDDASNLRYDEAVIKFGEEATNASVLHELENMERMNVFQFVRSSSVKEKVISSKLFIRSKHADGKFIKLKSRLVLRGDLQKGVDKLNVKSPTTQRSSINTMLALNKHIGGEIYSVDIPAAFLFADLDEDIYMSIPAHVSNIILKSKNLKGYTDNKGRLIVKLRKSIYGLRQAPINFYLHMRNALINMGYTVSASDSCIFSRRTENEITTIAIHVDDLLVSSNSTQHMEELKQKLAEQFGELQWNQREFTYLGMYLRRLDDHSVSIDMTAYAMDLAKRHEDLLIDYTGKTKDPSNLKLFSDINTEDEQENDPVLIKRFKSITMGLMYLSNVRADILKECIILSMCSNNPDTAAWENLKRVLKYVATHPSYCIKLGADSTELNVYSDASYGEHNDGRSHSGMFLSLGANGGPILIKSKKQSLVTQSSTEAEMLALVEAIKRALPVARLLVELGFNKRIAMTVHQDNLSTMHLANVGEGVGGKAKHFRVRYHFIKELIQEGVIDLKHCKTDDMIADIMTKPMVGKERARQTLRIMYAGDEKAFAEASAEALARVNNNRK